MMSDSINIKLLNDRASKGDEGAAHSLGVHYYGLNTSSDLPFALHNLQLSAEKYRWDNYYVGAIFQNRNKLKEAKESFQSTIDCPVAICRLAIQYAKSTDQYDRRLAVDLLKKLEDLKFELSNCDRDKSIITKEWLLEAANAQDPYASYLVGKWYAEGTLFDQSFPEALYYLQKSSDVGHPDASAYLSNMYSDGWGVNASDEKSLEYLVKAAQSNPWYMNRLGDRYMLEYINTKTDTNPSVHLEKVIDTYSKAYAIPDASLKLGLIYLSEYTVIDEKLAFNKVLDAAEKGQPNAIMELIHMLSNGIGVERSPEFADELSESIHRDRVTFCDDKRYLNNKDQGYVYERCPGITNDSDGKYHIDWATLIDYLHVYSDPSFVFRGDLYE